MTLQKLSAPAQGHNSKGGDGKEETTAFIFHAEKANNALLVVFFQGSIF